MTKGEAVNWLISIMSDIGKIEHQDLWHYEQALSEIRELLEAQPEVLACGEGELSAQPEQPEIVRCKDCKYLLPKGSFCSKDMCGLRGMAHYRHVDIHNNFCSWAERREDGEL